MTRPGSIVAGIAVAVALAAVMLSTSFSFAAALAVVSQRITVSSALAPAQTTCTLTASAADATIDQAAPTTDFGTSADLNVRSWSGSRNRRSLVRFNLSACAFPPSAQVTSATLELYLKARDNPPNRDLQAIRVTSAWTEAGVTWATPPTTAPAPTATTVMGNVVDVWLAWNVTADLAAFVAAPAANHGWLIRDALESEPAAPQGTFASKEHATVAQRPKLTILYTS